MICVRLWLSAALLPVLAWAGQDQALRPAAAGAPGDSSVQTESPRITASPFSPALLPVWQPPGGQIETGGWDTLRIDLQLPALERNPRSRRLRWIGAGLMVICGNLSYYYHLQAEAAYREYLISGDIAGLDRLFRQVEQLDRLAGWSYVGAEAGLLLVAFSFIRRP